MALFLFMPVVLAARQNQYSGYIDKEKNVGKKVVDPVLAQRGCILDRYGEELAGCAVRYEIFANPVRMAKQGVDIGKAAGLLADILGEPPVAIEGLLRTGQTHVVLCSSPNGAQREKISKLKDNPDYAELFKEVGIERFYERTYAAPGMPGNILGWVRRDEGQLVGVEGLELTLDVNLKGHDGKRIGLRGVNGLPIMSSFQVLEQPIKGDDVILTFDREIQLICYEAISHWVQKTGAKCGAAIVTKDGTGDFLAIAQYPAVDPAEYAKCVDNQIACSDFACRSLYEIGSAGKPFLAAMGISEGRLSPQSSFFVDNHSISLDGYTIGEYHTIWPSSGNHSLEEIIIRSSNIGMSRVGLSVGEATFREMFEKFGFTTQPEIFLLQMPEAKLPSPDKHLSKIEMANMSFGQGYAITPAMLVLGFNAIASDGWFYPGRLLCGVKDGVTGRVRLTDPAEGWRAISEDASSQMNGMLHKVTSDPSGTGKNAACEGYNVCGKTGTGQVASPRGGYYKEDEHYYKVTFAGYGPSEDPRYTVVVVLEKPRGGLKYNSGGKAAAPCFKQIFKALMDLDIRRSAEEGSLQAVD